MVRLLGGMLPLLFVTGVVAAVFATGVGVVRRRRDRLLPRVGVRAAEAVRPANAPQRREAGPGQSGAPHAGPRRRDLTITSTQVRQSAFYTAQLGFTI